MIRKALRKLKALIELVEHSIDRMNDTEKCEEIYHSLSPINNADPEKHYISALAWALKNRKKEDIKNIALTGPYGSGKSSILKTFISSNVDKSLHFLPISLATFKEEVREGIEFDNSKKRIITKIYFV